MTHLMMKFFSSELMLSHQEKSLLTLELEKTKVDQNVFEVDERNCEKDLANGQCENYTGVC